MPYKSPRQCSYPGCPNVTRGRYCAEHKTIANREYYEHGRDPSTKGRFDARWRKTRALFLSKHPLCAHCLESGFYVPATEVHHIKPISEGRDDSEENLMALCKSCHSRITLAENRVKYPSGQ